MTITNKNGYDVKFDPPGDQKVPANGGKANLSVFIVCRLNTIILIHSKMQHYYTDK